MATELVKATLNSTWTDVASTAASTAGVQWQNIGGFPIGLAFSTSAPGAADPYVTLGPGQTFQDNPGSAHVWAICFGGTSTVCATLNPAAGGSSGPSASQLPASLGAKTGALSLSVVPNTDTPFPVTPQATESHLGEVGGNQLAIQIAQTVTASSAYVAGNCVGGLMTLTNAARVAAGSGLIQSVVINSKSAQTTEIDIFIFSANPTGSTITDKTAFAVVAADFNKVLGVVPVTSWFAAGTPSAGQAQNLALPYELASGTTLYACAVTRATPTYAATSDISISFNLLRN